MKQIYSTVISVFFLILLGGLALLVVSKNDIDVPTKTMFQLDKNVDLKLILKAKETGQELLLATVLDGQGAELLQEFKEKSKKTTENKQYGIHWLKPIQYFQTKVNGKKVQGLIVTISDVNQWNTSINTLFGNVSVAKRVGHSGMVVQSSELTTKELYQFIDQCKLTSEIPFESANDLVQVTLNSEAVKGSFSVNQQQESIQLKGDFSLSEKLSKHTLSTRLAPNDFHITADLLPSALSEELKKITKIENEITGVSVNYRGLTVESANTGQQFLPDADFVLQFKNEVSQLTLKDVLLLDETQLTADEFSIGKHSYYWKQLTPTCLYIGKSKHPNLQSISGEIGVNISGKPSYLFELKGSPLIRMAMRMNPISAIGMDLSQQLKNSSISAKPFNDKQIHVEASFDFKHKELALIQLLQVVIKRN